MLLMDSENIKRSQVGMLVRGGLITSRKRLSVYVRVKASQKVGVAHPIVSTNRIWDTRRVPSVVPMIGVSAIEEPRAGGAHVGRPIRKESIEPARQKT